MVYSELTETMVGPHSWRSLLSLACLLASVGSNCSPSSAALAVKDRSVVAEFASRHGSLWWWRKVNHSSGSVPFYTSSTATSVAPLVTIMIVQPSVARDQQTIVTTCITIAMMILVVILMAWKRTVARCHGSEQRSIGTEVSLPPTTTAERWRPEREAWQRKQQFLHQLRQQDQADHYGYPHSNKGHIDTWRPHEFPTALIRPLTKSGPLDFCTKWFSAYGWLRGPRSLGQQRVQMFTRGSTKSKQNESMNSALVYVDYAGAALATRSQRQALLQHRTIWANPHSMGPAAAVTRGAIEHARWRILQHFSAGPTIADRPATFPPSLPPQLHFSSQVGYEILFTSGATEACRILSQQWSWRICRGCQQRPCLVMPLQVHTSLLGMRGPAMAGHPADRSARGARYICRQPMQELVEEIVHAASWPPSAWLDDDYEIRNEEKLKGSTSGDIGSQNERYHRQVWKPCPSCRELRHLIVLPAESNFGGDRIDAEKAIRAVREKSGQDPCSGQWYILLDVAKAASTSPIHLRKLDPDFACLSFYKLFGEPTGLGCLFVKQSSAQLLAAGTPTDEKASHDYFGGGSVDMVLTRSDMVVRRSSPTPLAALAHGTCHFSGICSLVHGFEELESLGGMIFVERHTSALATEFVRRLRSLCHCNKKPAAVLYGGWKCAAHGGHQPAGPTIAFNLLREDGSFIGHNEVAKLAALNSPPIQMRTGCFCNPGACSLALGLSDEDVLSNYQQSGHVCGDHIDIVDQRPTGAIRVSFGKDSIWEDMDAVITFIDRTFVSKVGRTPFQQTRSTSNEVVLSELYLFPIKSCAAQRVKRWKVHAGTGRLLFDREFALVDSTGSAMRLQCFPKMSQIHPVIDLVEETMTVSAPGRAQLKLSLNQDASSSDRDGIVSVCGGRCGGRIWGAAECSFWFSEFLGVPCWLVRHRGNIIQHPATLPLSSEPKSFANEQPVLLISKWAVDELNRVLLQQNEKAVNARHFRPNIVVDVSRRCRKGACASAHEDRWRSLQLTERGISFDVAGPCARCSMVDIDPSTGLKGKTLKALAGYRRSEGKISFGVFLRCVATNPSLEVWLEEGDRALAS